MNGHIWEIDGCENTNENILTEMAQGSGLLILNMIWRDLMEGPTKFEVLTVVVDFTKFGCTFELKSENASNMAKLMYRYIYTKFGDVAFLYITEIQHRLTSYCEQKYTKNYRMLITSKYMWHIPSYKFFMHHFHPNQNRALSCDVLHSFCHL